jgi:hypothetical protein
MKERDLKEERIKMDNMHSKNHSLKNTTVVTLTCRSPKTLLKLHMYSPISALPSPVICSVERPFSETMLVLEPLSFTWIVLFCTQVTEGVGTPPKKHRNKISPPR